MRLALGVALLCPPGAPGQEPPVFPSGVETVRVDVVVTDAKGRPVSGLRREDFVVREDGVPRRSWTSRRSAMRRPASRSQAAPAGPPPAEPPAARASRCRPRS